MKILMIARPNLYTDRGGDTVQVDNTAAELRKLGVSVHISVNIENEIVYQKYDLLHFFNIIDCEDIIGHVLKSNLPYVISTIYVDYREYDRHFRKGAIGLLSKFLSYNQVEYLKTVVKFILKNEKVSTVKYFWLGHSRSIKIILKRSACLLPNSENEYRRLYQDYQISKKYFVVPNAVNYSLFKKTEQGVKRDIVLCVARIEGRKNQLNLIKAMAGTGLKLVLIGAISPNQADYFQLCKKEAQDSVEFIPHITQAELLNYYARTRVHVLPSWFETTGLTSLEAAAMGCNVVVADRGDVRDYFLDHAFYCEPDRIESIQKAILEAWEQPYNENFGRLIREKYNWGKAAEETLRSYNYALAVV